MYVHTYRHTCKNACILAHACVRARRYTNIHTQIKNLSTVDSHPHNIDPKVDGRARFETLAGTLSEALRDPFLQPTP